jgi:uridine kinase
VSTQRAQLLDTVTAAVLRHRRWPVTRVAVDGVDGAGKTHFADELADRLRHEGVPVIRAGIDGFHRPALERYRRGRRSPEGFFLDSYDYATLRRVLLDPLSPGGNLRHRVAVFDVEADEPVDVPAAVADVGSILVVDGIFLHRDELVGEWDFSVFLRVSFAEATRRWHERDGVDVRTRSTADDRYVEGQRLYLATADPERRATVVVDNEDLSVPRVVKAAD